MRCLSSVCRIASSSSIGYGVECQAADLHAERNFMVRDCFNSNAVG